MLRLVEDLLTLSQLESTEMPASEAAIDVGALVADMAEEARALSGGRHQVALRVDEPATVLGNEQELRSAFTNLVSNAVRYTPPGGRVSLAWRRREGAGVFSVEDSGIGIAAEHIPRLTERFYRVDRSRSRDTGGTGLGLAIVKHVLTHHQATLEIESEPGRGSRFSAVFPAKRVRFRAAAAAA
jgi:two-component system phosphate regulon sensor histidine kinase PhoR